MARRWPRVTVFYSDSIINMEALSNFHRYIPRSLCVLLHVQRGDAKIVRVDTIEDVTRAILDCGSRGKGTYVILEF
jgi:hypothetical protein